MKLRRRTRPCLFDIQVNGFAGVDFQNPGITGEELRRACQALRRRRIHRILLTLTTDSIDSLERKFARVESLRIRDPLVREIVPGYHLEGPFMSPEDGYCGAHFANVMRPPNLREFERLQNAAGGNIRLVTIAPEWPGSPRFIEAVTRNRVVVSFGHTNADAEQIERAIRAGARLCTHLGNACPAILPRHDNVIQRLLARDELIACFIPDGFHLPPGTLKNFVRAKPADKIVLTSDCVSAAGLRPPFHFIQHRCGRILRRYCDRNGMVRLPGTKSHFAGSALTLDKGVANAARWTKFPESTAWEWASRVPAEIFGIRLPRIEA